MSKLEIELPEKIAGVIDEPCRYKVFYGGRGGAKSWSLARAAIKNSVANPSYRVLCGREIQKSIKQSVHQLLADQIKELNLGYYFDVLSTEIRRKGGDGGFNFAGLRHNATELKSYEGVDLCWVEEAQAVSAGSWKVLIPTIRKEASEIWVSFNPELEDDETYQRFVVHPPSESIVVKINWSDNPWFPDVLRKEKDELKEKNFDEFLNVWEGHCKEILDGAIYAEELRQAKADERITNVPVDMTKPVDVFFDLGWADCTSLWFVQTVGKEIRVVDFYQEQLKKIQHYVQVMQNKGYCYGKIFLPHDAYSGQLSGKNTAETLASLGFNTQRVDKISIQDGIRAARTIFSSCWFDQARCADGLAALRKYRYDVDEDTGKWSKDPLHDENSHAADAFRYFAVGYRPPAKKQAWRPSASGGWMGM